MVIDLTDIQTTWTEIRATWNKGATGVLLQIQAIEVALPFALLTDEQRIKARYIKKYDRPQTPYQRVINSEQVDPGVKQRLQALHDRLNPLILKQEIETKLRAIFRHVTVTPNVRQRL